MGGSSNKSHNNYKLKYLPLIHMIAASGGEIASILIITIITITILISSN